MTGVKLPPLVDLNLPYVGWLDHYGGRWQTVIVRRVEGRRLAHRLGDEVPLERARDMCHVLADVTGVQFAGELSKRPGFVPIAMGGAK